jgi:hypothetical protein
VCIAHDVDPIELVIWLPALCRQMNGGAANANFANANFHTLVDPLPILISRVQSAPGSSASPPLEGDTLHPESPPISSVSNLASPWCSTIHPRFTSQVTPASGCVVPHLYCICIYQLVWARPGSSNPLLPACLLTYKGAKMILEAAYEPKIGPYAHF